MTWFNPRTPPHSSTVCRLRVSECGWWLRGGVDWTGWGDIVLKKLDLIKFNIGPWCAKIPSFHSERSSNPTKLLIICNSKRPQSSRSYLRSQPSDQPTWPLIHAALNTSPRSFIATGGLPQTAIWIKRSIYSIMELSTVLPTENLSFFYSILINTLICLSIMETLSYCK